MKSIFTLAILATVSIASYGQDEIGVQIEQITQSAIPNGIEITTAGDDRFFVVDQLGKIMIVQSNGSVLGTPFLDITSQVPFADSQHGLLGLAFHPSYASNGKFYVYYIGSSNTGTLSEYTVSSNANVADAGSEVKLLTFDALSEDHKAGCIKFGKDGYLYIAVGDGGKRTWGANSQDLTNHLGSLLRVEVPGDGTIAIPSDNPFAGHATNKEEIWAYGLRNPWKFSFDMETGDLWIGDVGGDVWDEIDYQPFGAAGGANYGWPCYEADLSNEGNSQFETSLCDFDGEMESPVQTYFQPSPAIKVSITGGFVYRGSDKPYFDGWYIYGEAYTGEIYGTYKEGDSWEKVLLGQEDQFWVSFGQDINGEVYGLGLDFSQGSHIYKLNLQGPDVGGPLSIDHQGSEVKAYPNPATRQLNIKGFTQGNSVSLINLSGSLVREFGALNTGQINLDGIGRGVYLLKVANPDTGDQFTQRIIVQ